jgi:hypothetical protein
MQYASSFGIWGDGYGGVTAMVVIFSTQAKFPVRARLPPAAGATSLFVITRI